MDEGDLQALNWLQWLGVVLTPVAWVTHVLIAVAMQALVALAVKPTRLANPWWIGATFATAYAYSREKTEFEFHLKTVNHLRTVGPFWYRGFIPLEWDPASQFQFYVPAAAVILLAWAIERRRR